MTSADVREIVSSLAPPATPGPRKPPGPAPRKPEGISRELYSLIGNAAPTLVAQVRKPRFKQRPDLGRARVKWESKPFVNPARTDGLRLRHWAKQTDNSDYRFAKYNLDSAAVSYADDEYNAVFGTVTGEAAPSTSEDPAWTKEDTDYLFNLVRMYDQRWIVISDRYAPPSGVDRPIEELKARYYSVSKAVLEHRIPSDDPNKVQMLTNFNFDKEQEKARRAYVTKIFDRPPQQVEEEEALYLEVKRIEQTERRFTKEREELLKALAGVESGLSTLRVGEEPDDGRKKKRKADGMPQDSPLQSAGGLIGANKRAREYSRHLIEDDSLHCIVRTDPGMAGSSKSGQHISAFLRSTRIAAPKPAAAQRVTAILAELGVSANKLVMPSRTNVEKLESLINTASLLVEVKKQVDRIDQEMRTLKARKAGETLEDVEMADEGAVGEGSKSVSAVPMKRSMSISSSSLAANKRPRV